MMTERSITAEISGTQHGQESVLVMLCTADLFSARNLSNEGGEALSVERMSCSDDVQLQSCPVAVMVLLPGLVVVVVVKPDIETSSLSVLVSELNS